jgi:predicted  nucleic acid-binding Zn-ribbon protein
LDEKFKLLLRIQAIDTRLDQMKREKEKASKEIEKLREDLDLTKSCMEQDLSNLEELTRNARSVERDLEEVEAKIARSKVKLNEVKSNKEYQAVLKEIEDLKELTYQKEEDVIQWMEEIEIQEKESTENSFRWKQSEKEYQGKKEAFLQWMTELEKEAHSLSTQRAEVSKEVDEDLLKKYTTLRRHIKDRIVAPVIDAVCQGCHLGIPPQQYNDLMRGQTTQSCPNCNRFIYWGGEDETL